MHDEIIIQLTWPTIGILVAIGFVITVVRRKMARRAELESFVCLVIEAAEKKVPLSSMVFVRHLEGLKLTTKRISSLSDTRIKELADAIANIRGRYPGLRDTDTIPMPK